MKAPKPIKECNTLPTWIVSFGHPKVVGALVSYLRTVTLDFFLLQFLRKFKFIKIPIVHVDNPLDQKVPFNPRCIGDYLGFVQYWICPLALLIKTLGVRRAVPHLDKFYTSLKKAYKNAAKVYRFRLSTTDRPNYKRRIYFAGVHLLDPHYLCVPSLHITIVCLTYSFFRKVFDEEGYSGQEKDAWNKELYEGAVRIAETVLYVKQHSVNCISAALYMTSMIFADLFSEEDALAFLDSMFAGRKDIPGSDRDQVIQHMKDLFLQFRKEAQTASDWTEPVKNWLIKTEKSADNR